MYSFLAIAELLPPKLFNIEQVPFKEENDL
jgi:hypothetical protein